MTNYQQIKSDENIQAVKAPLLGRKVEMNINSSTVAYATLFLRIVMGWTLFQSGITKIFDPTWTAAGFLESAVPEANPFMSLWAGFAGNPTVDFLVQWGLMLTGLGLIIGALV